MLEDILELAAEEKVFWEKIKLSENYFMEELGIFNTV